MAESRAHARPGGLSSRPELLGIFISRLSRSANRYLGAALRDRGIGAGQHAVILALHREGSLRQDELAQALDVDQAHVTRMLQHLSDAGYLTRSVDPRDGRARRAELTDRGTGAVPWIEAAMRAWNESVLGPLDSREREEFLSLLGRLGEPVTDSEAGR